MTPAHQHTPVLRGKCLLREAAHDSLGHTRPGNHSILPSPCTLLAPPPTFAHTAWNACPHTSSTQAPAPPGRSCWDHAAVSWEESGRRGPLALLWFYPRKLGACLGPIRFSAALRETMPCAFPKAAHYPSPGPGHTEVTQ